MSLQFRFHIDFVLFSSGVPADVPGLVVNTLIATNGRFIADGSEIVQRLRDEMELIDFTFSGPPLDQFAGIAWDPELGVVAVVA